VGTIRTSSMPTKKSPVHPHGRGDNALLQTIDRAARGSPPRAWGQSFRGSATRAYYRFTPTGVGTIVSGKRHTSVLSVHPHGRGDNASASHCVFPVPGSPPRAWGQLRISTEIAVIVRFTPTGVGTITAG